MGAALRRTAFSPNIKERRDYSCAVFDSAGGVIAMGDHMPVHLGSMPMSVCAAVAACEMSSGDVVMLNDPIPRRNPSARYNAGCPRIYRATQAGCPRFLRGFARSSCRRRRSLRRFHGPLPRNLSGRISHSTSETDAGRRDESDVLALLLNNVRTPEEREGDLGAQFAACHTGAERLREVCSRYGLQRANRAADELQDYSEELMRAFL